jgi:hypothetical protein
MNTTKTSDSPALAEIGSVMLDGEGVRAMRHRLHELANVFTGVMIAAGLLSQYLEGGSLRHHASNICESSERGCGLVREIRSQLIAACGEVEVAPNGSSTDLKQGQ